LDKIESGKISTFDVQEWENSCFDAMNDDFNTPILIANLFEAVKVINHIKEQNASLTAPDLLVFKKALNGFVFDVYNEDALYGSFASAYKLFQDKKHYAIARVNAYDGAIDITDQATSWNKEFYRLFNRIFVNPALVLPLKKEIKLEDEEQKITRKMSVESPDIFDVIPYKFYNLLKMNLKSVLMRRRTKFKIRIDILPAPKSVYIAGSWDNWETKHEMLFNSLSQTWDCYIQIMPGTYYYKFNDETTWFVNKQAAVEVDEDANENNVVSI